MLVDSNATDGDYCRERGGKGSTGWVVCAKDGRAKSHVPFVPPPSIRLSLGIGGGGVTWGITVLPPYKTDWYN